MLGNLSFSRCQNNLNGENQVKLSLGTCLIPFPIFPGSVGTLRMVVPGQQSPSPSSRADWEWDSHCSQVMDLGGDLGLLVPG